MPTIAFIGTRDLDSVPVEARDAFLHAARCVGQYGLTLVTGAAPGADQAAADSALRADGHIRLVLPWASYETNWVRAVQQTYHSCVETLVYDPDIHAEWTRSVFTHHPNPNRLSRGTVMLLARNFGIVASAAAVVALPRLGPVGPVGGTAHGIRVATALGIPVFMLHDGDARRRVDTVIALEALADMVDRGDLATEHLPYRLRERLAALLETPGA